jgi:elongation factor G
VLKKGYTPAETRTFAVVGHRSAGKTSLGDILLQATGVTRTVGKVDEGASLLDWTPEAQRRRQTLEIQHAWMTWRDHLLNLVDVPGALDLRCDQDLALDVVDGFVLVLAANDGVPHGARNVLSRADRLGLPGLLVLSQIDRTHDLPEVLAEVARATGRRPVLLQLPFYDEEGRLSGVIDLARQVVLRHADDGSFQVSEEPVPARFREEVASVWERSVEAVASDDDNLLEHYLEFLELSQDQIRDGLQAGTRAGRLLPVLLASAAQVIGAGPLLDAMVDLLPPPGRVHPDLPEDGRFSASVLHQSVDPDGRPYTLLRVWTGDGARGGDWIDGETGRVQKVRKVFQVRGPRRAVAHSAGAGSIIASWDGIETRPGRVLVEEERSSMPLPQLPPRMIARRLAPASPGDADRMERALPWLLRMDHALDLVVDPLDRAPVVHARFLGQLERAAGWLRDRLGVNVDLELPRVAYREAPCAATLAVEGVHVRESHVGLVEEYGKCAIDLSPDGACAGVAFQADCDEESLPRRFHGAVADGAREAALRGPLGYPVIGARVTCVSGDYDMLCSTEDHFRRAGAAAMKAALDESGTRLLEPWTKVTVYAAPDEVGAVLSDLVAHRGRIVDVRVDDHAEIEAVCPEREARSLQPRLGAITGGRGWFSTSHSHYDVLPDALVAEALGGSGRAGHGTARRANA